MMWKCKYEITLVYNYFMKDVKYIIEKIVNYLFDDDIDSNVKNIIMEDALNDLQNNSYDEYDYYWDNGEHNGNLMKVGSFYNDEYEYFNLDNYINIFKAELNNDFKLYYKDITNDDLILNDNIINEILNSNKIANAFKTLYESYLEI